MKILLIDDHPIIFESLKSLIQKHKPSIQVNYINTPQNFQLSELNQYSLIILDLNFCGEFKGIDILKSINTQNFHPPILVMSMHDDADSMEKLNSYKYDLFISKSESATTIINNIFFLLKIETVNTTNASSEAEQVKSTLSRREKEILDFVVKGLTSKEISEKLSISHRTVEVHRRNLLTKFKSKNTAELLHRLAS